MGGNVKLKLLYLFTFISMLSYTTVNDLQAFHFGPGPGDHEEHGITNEPDEFHFGPGPGAHDEHEDHSEHTDDEDEEMEK